jgi:hypothetical protein
MRQGFDVVIGLLRNHNRLVIVTPMHDTVAHVLGTILLDSCVLLQPMKKVCECGRVVVRVLDLLLD